MNQPAIYSLNRSPSADVPLGFSDLTQDERMLVCIFRSWHRHASESPSSRTTFETHLREMLKLDRLCSALTDLFLFFRSFNFLRAVCVNEHEVLSPSEEDLLRILGTSTDTVKADTATHNCRMQLKAVHMLPRAIEDINRSGHDHLEAQIAKSYQAFLTFPL